MPQTHIVRISPWADAEHAIHNLTQRGFLITQNARKIMELLDFSKEAKDFAIQHGPLSDLGLIYETRLKDIEKLFTENKYVECPQDLALHICMNDEVFAKLGDMTPVFTEPIEIHARFRIMLSIGVHREQKYIDYADARDKAVYAPEKSFIYGAQSTP